jgi:hypothetical protein
MNTWFSRLTACGKAGGCITDVMQHSSESYHQGHAFFTAKKYVRHRTRPPPMAQYLSHSTENGSQTFESVGDMNQRILICHLWLGYGSACICSGFYKHRV